MAAAIRQVRIVVCAASQILPVSGRALLPLAPGVGQQTGQAGGNQGQRPGSGTALMPLPAA